MCILLELNILSLIHIQIITIFMYVLNDIILTIILQFFENVNLQENLI